MGFDRKGPKRAKFSDAMCGQAAVRWDDPKKVGGWVEAVGEAGKDLHAAGRDRVRGKRKRVLSRHEAGRQLRDAWYRMTRLLRAGEAGLGRLGPCEPEPPEGKPEDAPPFSSSRPTTPPETAS